MVSAAAAPVSAPAIIEAISSHGSCAAAAHEPSIGREISVCPSAWAHAPPTLTPITPKRARRSSVMAVMAAAPPTTRK